jgi:2'-5' RNA ligase
MRLFIAIACPPEVRQRLAQAQGLLLKCGGMKAVEPENIHLTLKFLGEVGPQKAKDAAAALKRVEIRRFRIEVAGLGAFPNPGRPKVLWAGLREGAKEASGLHDSIEAALSGFGFEREERFHPHITLARVKGETDAMALAEAIQAGGQPCGGFEARSFDLMESRLGPGGPAYVPLESFPLR